MGITMNTAAFYHKATDNYCYALDENQLSISIRTGYDIQNVFLCYGDPFQSGIMGGKEQWTGSAVEITRVRNLREHKFWSVAVKPSFKRCRYYFRLSDGRDTVFFADSGVYTQDEWEQRGMDRLDFYFPWMNESDIYRMPDWVPGTVWYQIFPDRFCNGDPGNDPRGVLPWARPGQSVRNEEIYGGDIAGIESKLDYLKDLGVGGIYLTPVNESISTHKYDTSDYYKIDPSFGTREDMKRLTAKAHAKGIRIMLDGVFNHCSVAFPQWKDVMEKGPESEYYDWFMINEWPLREDGGNAWEGRYYTFAFIDCMPKLNTNNPDVIEELLRVCTYWVEEYDIDALRLDVANEVSHTFCRALRKRMFSLKPDFYIVGEIWHDSAAWLRGDEFDSVMNYPLRQAVNSLGAASWMDAGRFEQEINRCYTMYSGQINRGLFNLLDSHDTIRQSTRLGDSGLFELQLFVLFTMTGSLCIYYGTEIALEGEHDPDCRRPMPWKEIERGDYVRQTEFTQSLIRLRGTYPSLSEGECLFTASEEENGLLRYRKEKEGAVTIEVVVNLSQEPVSVREIVRGRKAVLCGQFDASQGRLLPKGFLALEV